MKYEAQDYSFVVQVLLGCGMLDVDFLISESESFDVEIDEAIEVVKDSDSELDVNTLLYAMYDIAVTRAMSETGVDRLENYGWDGIEIFTNCIDSSVRVDGERAADYQQLKELLEKLNK